MPSRRAVFLDRDGVIVENQRECIKSWEELEFLPEAYEALRRLNQTDYAIVLVTNQSAVGRGIIMLEQGIAINARFTARIEGALTPRISVHIVLTKIVAAENPHQKCF